MEWLAGTKPKSEGKTMSDGIHDSILNISGGPMRETKPPVAGSATCSEAAELDARITNYLGNGGLFNPEYMEHEKVRDLLIDLREYLRRQPQPPN